MNASEVPQTEVGSYFISNYPPYSLWNRDALGEIQATLQTSPKGEAPLGLYLHIPYCRKRCKFCYFKVITDVTAPQVQRYVDALSTEISLISKLPLIGNRSFRFIYFGGGTPSFLSPKQLTALADRLRQHVSWDGAEEVTFECEPGTLSETKVKTLKEGLGVTRLSLGIENFSDSVLQENGRAHLSRQVFDAWEWIAAANFSNVNVDLIAGMVGETWDNWKENIQKTIQLDPESVTIYQMELPFNTVYSQALLESQGQSPVADWPTKRAWVDYAFNRLEAAGYSVSSAYTMVKNPAKVNFSYRDHLWEGSDLLAAGIASFGYAAGVHYQNLADVKRYHDELESGRLPLGRALRISNHQQLIRQMILQLKRGYLDFDVLNEKFGVDVYQQWKDVWNLYIDQGSMKRTQQGIVLSRDGLLRVDSLLPAFFEPEHRGIRYT